MGQGELPGVGIIIIGQKPFSIPVVFGLGIAINKFTAKPREHVFLKGLSCSLVVGCRRSKIAEFVRQRGAIFACLSHETTRVPRARLVEDFFQLIIRLGLVGNGGLGVILGGRHKPAPASCARSRLILPALARLNHLQGIETVPGGAL